ncbi:MAG: hypothetical protein GY699_22470 [Desulfobacteraceae bacterium]|nr:hypothetical protein [Desulfobacteraceae bacterium]
MRSGKSFIYVLLSLFFLISACQDEKGKGDYSGVSELIAGRNKARYDVAENTPKKSDSSKKRIVKKTPITKSNSNSNKEELTSIILYEEDVEIVGSQSQRILAKGVAYVNKKGQIVRIKILKE